MTADGISTAELQEVLAAGRPITVVDIRSADDREWSIPGSISVDVYDTVKAGGLGPLAEFDFPPGPVVTVCGMGRTAAIAAKLLRESGVDAVTLDGGMRAWSRAWNIAEATIADSDVVQVRRTGKGCLSYIVASQGEAVVIDASVDEDVYVRLLNERGWRLVSVVDTHVHADHLSRAKRLAGRMRTELYLPAQDRIRYPFRPLMDGDRILFGSAELIAWHTPGHTAESTSYVLNQRAAFTGDTLFLSSVGRPDLEGGGQDAAIARARSLHTSMRRLLDLAADTLVLPGHVSEPIAFDHRLLATTVAGIRNNVELTRLTADAFVAAVLARIPTSPPNHSRILELNEQGELPDDPSELETGANRCAVN